MTTASRAATIALLGAPNTGKSTLINRLVGAKVSIVSPKVQTTRMRVLGIVLHGSTQLVFIDTPGVFMPKRRLDRAMVKTAWAGVKDSDEVILLVDAIRGYDVDTRRIVAELSSSGQRIVLALNKIDCVKRETLLPLAEQLGKDGPFAAVFMISALTGDGVEDLSSYLVSQAPEGPWLFPADQVSDVPLRLMAAELVREQVFMQLRQELPYEITVETDEWRECANGAVRIEATIHVARDSQKAIVLGRGGMQLKRIGTTARLGLEQLFNRRVHLFLRVRVSEKWMDKRDHYSALRLDFEK